MERMKVIVLTLLTAICLLGCGRVEDSRSEPNDEVGSITQADGTADSDSLSDTDIADEIAPIPLYQGTYESCLIQEDDQYLYFCGSCRVSKTDKTTGEEIIIWENAEEIAAKKEYLYSRGTGLLLGDRIYFIEIWYDEENMQRALSCVCTDGTGYERLLELKYRSSDIMLLQNGMLYVDDMNREVWFQVYEDGTLSGPDELEREYLKQIFYTNNGERLLFYEEGLKEFGYYLEQTEDGYIAAVNPDTGEKIYVPELVFFEGYNSKYFVCATYEDGMSLKVMERDGLETRVLLTVEDNFDILGIDEEYVYIMQYLYEGDEVSYSYEKVSFENGDRQEIFVREPSPIMNYKSDILMDTVIQNGYIYYMDEQDYKFYRMRRKLDAPEKEEILGEVVYDTGISSVGTIQSRKEKLYSESEPEKQLYNVDLSWLAVDDKFPGSNLINTYLIAHQDSNVAYAEGELEWMLEDEWNFSVCSELSSKFSGFSYVDSHYISFVQEENEYQSGAAHGMPWWIGFTFDLETGERLLLSDIMYNSEEELKEIVTRYFAEMIQEHPEGYFWNDAIESVHEWTNYESDFYLTEAGIVFYYGPYDLASYAAGFQEVTIPFEEFELRIILENITK